MMNVFARPTLPATVLRQLALAALTLLAVALVAQYGFHLKPCHLCILQRLPYAALAVLGLLGTLLSTRLRWLQALFVVSALLLAGEIGLAGYHSAVERHWVAGPSDCTTGDAEHLSLEEMRAKILGAAVTRCDEPVWMIPGVVTMANANLLAALTLLAMLVQRRRLFRIAGSDIHILDL